MSEPLYTITFTESQRRQVLESLTSRKAALHIQRCQRLGMSTFVVKRKLDSQLTGLEELIGLMQAVAPRPVPPAPVETEELQTGYHQW